MMADRVPGDFPLCLASRKQHRADSLSVKAGRLHRVRHGQFARTRAVFLRRCLCHCVRVAASGGLGDAVKGGYALSCGTRRLPPCFASSRQPDRLPAKAAQRTGLGHCQKRIAVTMQAGSKAPCGMATNRIAPKGAASVTIWTWLRPGDCTSGAPTPQRLNVIPWAVTFFCGSFRRVAEINQSGA